MAKRKYGFDEARIQRFIKEGRGAGVGKFYKPWLTVADVPSLGRAHRLFCPKTGREHHLLSDNEYFTFLLLWWDDSVVDIREQFPLIDRRETLEIAACCGIEHPTDPISGALWVITTDLLVTRLVEGRFVNVAYSVKEEDALNNMRAVEKLEIERVYWKRRKFNWLTCTNKEVKTTFTRNLAWILDAGTDQHHRDELIDDRLLCRLYAAILSEPYVPIRHLCKLLDERHSLASGTMLRSLRKGLGAKHIHVNMALHSIQDLPASEFLVRGYKS